MASKISPTVEYTGVPNGGIPIATAGVMMVPMIQPTPQPISQPIQANINSYYGNHIALQTASYGEVKLLYKAEFDYYIVRVVPTLSLPHVVSIEVVLISISMRMLMSITPLLFVFNVAVSLVLILFVRVTLTEESLINKDAYELFNVFVVHHLCIQGMFNLSVVVKIALSAGMIA
eukprot:CAMPEP_0173149734 /NCGR_PEP_ID=MMETSP1105-20130129/10511_1 /TAXON_ID=2985 /ORGANISM="Ochromonas sp., Strain BG-1" /LENGTH=174 /DNA_ID=CAMNT_0014064675 /DNA_START=85 /DNA_END=610 /DNA_ORIENTATION=-